uniref:Probable L-cysteine desulfhydrase, chloroplastic n=1 Tax=Crassostrea virginica TaxID=6565 RepID=A0A8B8E1I1_CRAVI|nr:probable L-cysteine desulfhydrase, chloroplastic [Crassostrea virginica]
MALSQVEFGEEIQSRCFHFEKGFTFVNHGSFGVVPTPIREKQKQLLDVLNDNPGLFYRQTWKQLLASAKLAAAHFLGADPGNIVFVQNATTGVNSVLKAFPWQKGDEILATVHTYKAVEYACRKAAQFSTGGHIHQFEIQFPIQDEAEVVSNMTSALDEHPKIKLVVLDHITSPSALVLPLKKMIEECRKRGVLVLVDGAHAPGQVEINLEELRPDFYTGNFHKWVFTPRGCAILWVHKDHHDWCTPLVTSHMYNKGFQLEYGVQGTRDDTPYFLVPDSIQFYKDVGGMERINKYTEDLLDQACKLTAERLHTELPRAPPTMLAPGMRLVLLPEYQGYPKTWEGSEDLYMDIMNKHKINCAIYPIQGELYLRLSANIYNRLADYEKLAQLLVDMLKNGR